MSDDLETVTVCVRLDRDGMFVAHIKEMRGCLSSGRTVPEAIAHLAEAAELWLAPALR